MIKENGTILIPVDFSEQSLAAVKSAYKIGKFSKSKLLILYIFQKQNEENEKRIESLAKQTTAESGLVCDFVSMKGDFFEETISMAKTVDVNLIIVGLDRNIKSKSLFGISPINKLIKKSPCPVLTVRSSSVNHDYSNILMPFDLSAEAREKVGTVIQLAKYFTADIRIVSVFDPNDAKYENELLPYLQQVKKYIKDKSVNCTNKSIPSKDTIGSLLDYAEKNNCGLIVQMNKKDLNIGELINGSESQKMIDMSTVPVLSINPMVRESISSSVH